MNYSQNAGQRHRTKRHKRRRKKRNLFGVFILRVFVVLIVVGVIAVVGLVVGSVAGIIGMSPTLNAEDVIPESYTSILYDENGNEIDKLHGEENREYVKLSSIPVNMRNAIVAIEDARFYEHNGIDFRGMARALVVDIVSRDFSQGASTITQQLMKNEVLTSEKKLTRKIQEQYLAVAFEKHLTETLGSKQKTKEYILELYLNSISLNHGLNGVQAAAKFYFGKDVSQLDLAECASIAGITKNPSAYSPLTNPKNNKERQTLVLDKMLEQGYISQSEYDSAIKEDIYSNIVGETKDSDTPANHSYFVDSVIVQLANQLIEEKQMSKQQAYNMIYSGGLQVYTTVDTDMQSAMEESFKDDSLFPPKCSTMTASYTISVMDNTTQEQTHTFREQVVTNQEEAEAFAQSVKDEVLNSGNTLVAEKLDVSKSLQAAMVIMDYHNGQVKAIVGGREKTGDLVFNRATQALRQPGSCFKVLASFAPAIDMDVAMPGSLYRDEEFTYNGWSPKNWYTNGYRGWATIRDGVRDSLNIVAAKTIVDVGVDNAFSYLENFGFTTLESGVNENGLTDRGAAISLGGITNGISTLELTAAYSTIANNGVYNKPVFYTKVLDHNGNVVIDNTQNEGKRVLKETTAYMLTDMMKDVITSGTGKLAKLNGITVAGKTGTTNDDKDLMFAGYTPYYCAGIWMGYDTPKKMEYDKSYHLLLWKDVMDKVHHGLSNKEIMDKPDGLTSITLCAAGNGAATSLCAHDYYGTGGYYHHTTTTDLATTTFKSGKTCTVHKQFEICKIDGKLASNSTPAEDRMSVVLAVDGENNILNKPSNIKEGELNIDLHSSCEGGDSHKITEENPDSIFENEKEENGEDTPSSNTGSKPSGNTGNGNTTPSPSPAPTPSAPAEEPNDNDTGSIFG